MPHLRKTAVVLTVASAVLLAGCAGGTLQRLPDGTYERESVVTREQRAADTLRRDGAGEAAREAQKRADKALEEERRSPVSTFLSDLLYMFIGLAVDSREKR